jgi:hypothetical protein
VWFDPVISAAAGFFQPAIEGDKKIPATHFFYVQLRFPLAAIAPGDDRPGVSADDGFERQFQGRIKCGETIGRQPSITRG